MYSPNWSPYFLWISTFVIFLSHISLSSPFLYIRLLSLLYMYMYHSKDTSHRLPYLPKRFYQLQFSHVECTIKTKKDGTLLQAL